MRSRRAAALCASIGMATVALLRPLHAQYSADTGLKFVEHTLATELRGGYQSLIVDLNKDGKPDIIALASNLPDLLWFENPGWQRHVLAGGFTGLINVAAFDVDKDGIPELAVASGFTMSPKTSAGIVSILTHGADVTAPWTVKEIDRVPTAHPGRTKARGADRSSIPRSRTATRWWLWTPTTTAATNWLPGNAAAR